MSMKPIREVAKYYGSQRKSNALQLKESLMQKAQLGIKNSGKSHGAIGELVGCSRQRITSLSSGQIELFSIEWLMDFLEKFGGEK